MASFLHVREHWGASRPGDLAGRVVLSELPFGDSPVVCGARCLNFVLDGVERYEINGRTLTVRAGEFIYVESGTTARVVLPLRQVTRGLCVYLPVPDDEPEPSLLGDAFQLATSADPLSRSLGDVARKLSGRPEQGDVLAPALVRQAMVELERLTADLAPKLLRIEAARPATRRDLLQKLERARRYLHDHPGRAVALPELAQVAAMSPFHLARTFRTVFGCPPAEYHRRRRIEAASRDMAARDISVSEAAERYGFADASSFSRAYRKLVGTSPKARGWAVRP